MIVGDGWRLAQIAALAAVVLSGWLLGRMATRGSDQAAQ